MIDVLLKILKVGLISIACLGTLTMIIKYIVMVVGDVKDFCTNVYDKIQSRKNKSSK